MTKISSGKRTLRDSCNKQIKEGNKQSWITWKPGQNIWKIFNRLQWDNSPDISPMRQLNCGKVTIWCASTALTWSVTGHGVSLWLYLTSTEKMPNKIVWERKKQWHWIEHLLHIHENGVAKHDLKWNQVKTKK